MTKEKTPIAPQGTMLGGGAKSRPLTADDWRDVLNLIAEYKRETIEEAEKNVSDLMRELEKVDDIKMLRSIRFGR